MRKKRFFTISCRKNLEIRLEQKNVKIKTRKEVKIMEEIKVAELEDEMGGLGVCAAGCTAVCVVMGGAAIVAPGMTVLAATAPSPI